MSTPVDKLDNINVTVMGEELTISPTTAYTDLRHALMVQDAIRAGLEDNDSARQLMRIARAKLAACVTAGEPPTLEDCLYRVPVAEWDAWQKAAKALNPQWFELDLSALEIAPDEKKS